MRCLTLLAALFFLQFCSRADSIAVFYALDSDAGALKQNAREAGQPISVGMRHIQRLAIGKHSVYAVKMGSGCVETALSAQALLSRFRCDWALSIGPAGALSDNLELGCWHRVAQVFAYQRGNGASRPMDATWSADWARLPSSAVIDSLLYGASDLSVASGEAFIATTSDRDRLRATTGAAAVDMNSFGLVEACADHAVPLFIWRVISDRADEHASVDFRTFATTYRGEGGAALAKWIAALPANPSDPLAYPAIQEIMEDAGSNTVAE
ncbi:MAG: hypothetical protein M9935_00385 [Kiritimatiellae bacterium]|nr:hypothetical protein [Kiritimatiellia bacterium]